MAMYKEATVKTSMPRLQAWFQRWWPIVAALTPMLAGAALWWLTQYFVTEKVHAADVATLRREAVARWEAHTIWTDEVLKRVSARLDLYEKFVTDNTVEHKDMHRLLLQISVDVSELRGSLKNSAKP